MASRVHSVDGSTLAQPSTTGKQDSFEGCFSEERTPFSNDLSREEEDYIGQRDDCAKKLEPEMGEESSNANGPNLPKRTLSKRVQYIFRTSMEKVTTKIEQAKPSQRNPQQMKGLLDVLDPHNESVRHTIPLAKNWRKFQGCNNFWSGLLEPSLDPVLRAEIYRYGKFAKATYDAFNRDTGDSKYKKEKLFASVGLEKRGYEITHFLYTTAKLSLLKSFSNANLKEMSNWMGFVAVCTDPDEIRRLGRRDVVVAWRGTVTWLEWIKDFQFWPKPIEFNQQSDANKGVPVHGGFLSLYTSSYEESSSGKMSARNQVLEAVKSLVEQYEQEDKDQDIELSITVTGHSLGSALATLCACDIAEWILRKSPAFGSGSGRVDRSENASSESSPKDRIPITVYSFAGPRVGKQALKKRIETLNVPVLRVLNKADVVPILPIFQSYEHIGIKLEVNNLKCDCGGPKKAQAIRKTNSEETAELNSKEITEEKTNPVHDHHAQGIWRNLNPVRYHRLRYLLDALNPTCDSTYNIAVAKRKLKVFYRYIVAATKFRPTLKLSSSDSELGFESSSTVQRFEEGTKAGTRSPQGLQKRSLKTVRHECLA